MMKYCYWALFFLFQIPSAFAIEILIENSEQLINAFQKATPGTKLILLPGDYKIYRLNTLAAGTAENPITVVAKTPGSVFISTTGSEALSVYHSYWIFKNLTITGGPLSDHAFHVSGNANHIIIKQNTLIDFHAQIKVNGSGSNLEYPDNGLIEDNDLYNTTARMTDESVTPIDIVGGKSWVVRGNYIADFAKGQHNTTSYGVFIKGNSLDGLIENNLVICSKGLSGGTRIGISLGGGGTGKEFCENQDCKYEHTNGVIRNNIVLNCSDAGVYLNRARHTTVSNNTLLMTTGIDVHYPGSSAVINNNILTGAIRERSGGEATVQKNVAFGTSAGMWLPALSEKLRTRISDYNIKYPKWVSKGTVESTQLWIGDLFSYLGKTSLGLGQNKTLECFPGMVLGNLKPDVEECGSFWQNNEASVDNPSDFWGNKRSVGQDAMGAINFYNSSCDINPRIQHKPATLPDTCLD